MHRCHTSGLRAKVRCEHPGASQEDSPLVLTNTSRHACTPRAHPGAAFVGADCRRVRGVVVHAGLGEEKRPRVRLVGLPAVVDPGPRLCRGSGEPVEPWVWVSAVFCSSACRSLHAQVASYAPTDRGGHRRDGEVRSAVRKFVDGGGERVVPAVYCSSGCRKRAWRERRAAALAG
ncbi:DUF4232 domain-containing protein [Streptomyces avermitilis]|uniref:DUF4232 domain-containing protein n=1 Tax=Streptomyces avermitilis TaxID=33903 RepID=UPI00340B68D4